MLFLVRRDIKFPANMAPDRVDALKVQELIYVCERKLQGKILACGELAHKTLMYFIYDYDNTAEMQLMLADSPFAPFAKQEVSPLVGPAEGPKIATHRLESLNAEDVPMRR